MTKSAFSHRFSHSSVFRNLAAISQCTCLRSMGSFLVLMRTQRPFGFMAYSLAPPWVSPSPAWILQEFPGLPPGPRGLHKLRQVTSVPSHLPGSVSPSLLPWAPCPTTSGQSAKLAVISPFCGPSEPIFRLSESMFSCVTENFTCEFSRSLFRIH